MPEDRTLLASAGRDRTVRLWDPVTGTLYAELAGHTGPVRALAAVSTPEGTLLATADNDRAIIAWKPHAFV
jgi:WD40 repeat protein